MEMLALLLVVPLAWPFIAKLIFKHELTLGEVGANLAIGVIVVVVGYYGSRYVKTMDTEILNGAVLSKSSERVSCEHSYSCNCRQVCSTDSSGRRSCSESCDTCYEHSHDVDWHLNTNVGDIKIDRVDRQGVREPQRFSRAQIGDPVAQTHRYTNYIQASPNSLFNTVSEKMAYERFKESIPEYPKNIYDYHYLNRVLQVGVSVPDASVWNHKLALLLRSLGPKKEANIVLVFTAFEDPDYAAALRSAWLGGKKNDIVIVLGTPHYPDIAWAKVLGWSDSELFKIQLSDDIRDLKVAEPDAVLNLVNTHAMAQYQRKNWSDFDYLQWDIEPPTWWLVVLFFLSIAASVGSSVYFSRNAVRAGGYSSFRAGNFRRR